MQKFNGELRPLPRPKSPVLRHRDRTPPRRQLLRRRRRRICTLSCSRARTPGPELPSPSRALRWHIAHAVCRAVLLSLFSGTAGWLEGCSPHSSIGSHPRQPEQAAPPPSVQPLGVVGAFQTEWGDVNVAEVGDDAGLACLVVSQRGSALAYELGVRTPRDHACYSWGRVEHGPNGYVLIDASDTPNAPCRYRLVQTLNRVRVVAVDSSCEERASCDSYAFLENLEFDLSKPATAPIPCVPW